MKKIELVIFMINVSVKFFFPVAGGFIDWQKNILCTFYGFWFLNIISWYCLQVTNFTRRFSTDSYDHITSLILKLIFEIRLSIILYILLIIPAETFLKTYHLLHNLIIVNEYFFILHKLFYQFFISHTFCKISTIENYPINCENNHIFF